MLRKREIFGHKLFKSKTLILVRSRKLVPEAVNVNSEFTLDRKNTHGNFVTTEQLCLLISFNIILLLTYLQGKYKPKGISPPLL